MLPTVIGAWSDMGQESGSFQYQFGAEEQIQEQFTRIVDDWSDSKWFTRSPLSSHIYMDRCQNLRGFGVVLKSMFEMRYIIRDDERCTHCGACITICPTEALYMDKKSMKVIFDDTKCIACELCVKGCPPRAMKVEF